MADAKEAERTSDFKDNIDNGGSVLLASESDDSMSGVEDNRNTSSITLDAINENEVCKITIALLKLYLRAIEIARKRGTLPKYISTGQIHLFKKGKLICVFRFGDKWGKHWNRPDLCTGDCRT